MNKILIILLLSIMILGVEILYVPKLASGSNIIQAEYFIDDDPGEGNGFTLSALDGAFDSPEEQVEINPDTSALKIGTHNIYVRMQNEELLWGTPRKILFEITGEKYISAAEYFVDSPCEGVGTPMPPEDGTFDQLKENAFAGVDTSDLSLGLHTIYVRMKDSEDLWGTCRAYKVEVREPPYITGGEIFVDECSEPGTGIPMTCKDKACDSIIENLEGLLRTWCLDLGPHTLFAKATDSYYRWGNCQAVDILVDDVPPNFCEGDFTIPVPDGDVDGSDLAIFAADFGRTDCSFIDPCEGDFDCDGDEDGSDLAIFAADFGRANCPMP